MNERATVQCPFCQGTYSKEVYLTKHMGHGCAKLVQCIEDYERQVRTLQEEGRVKDAKILEIG